jgi:hypothetical protein
MQIAVIVIILLLQAGIVGVGIYLAAYLKKKAQNLATHEDFEDLKKQTAELTRISGQIETELKSDLWDRQKRWQLKREVLFEVVKNVAAVFDALNGRHTVAETERDASSVVDAAFLRERKIDTSGQFLKSIAALNESRLFVGVTCGKEVLDAVINYALLMTTVFFKINNENDAEIYPRSLSEILHLQDSIREVIRKELRIELGVKD